MFTNGLRGQLELARCSVADSKEKLPSEDSPQEMMKRLFAVAHLILQSDSYKKVSPKPQKKRAKTQN